MTFTTLCATVTDSKSLNWTRVKTTARPDENVRKPGPTAATFTLLSPKIATFRLSTEPSRKTMAFAVAFEIAVTRHRPSMATSTTAAPLANVSKAMAAAD